MSGRLFSIHSPLIMEIILAIRRSNFLKSHGVFSGAWESEEREQVVVVDGNYSETVVIM